MDSCLVENGSWTDEKHRHFLNFLESSFLHTVFGDYRWFAGARLDRELPDRCESTGDSGSRRRRRKKKKKKKKMLTHLSKGRGIVKKPRKSIRSTTRRYYDQIVPQLEKRSGEEEEKDHHRHHQQQQIKDIGLN